MSRAKRAKSNKRTLIILILAIIALIGVAGYGVWSRFYTNGDFGASNTISVSEFNPTVDGTFIYNAASSSRNATVDEYDGGYYVYDTVTIRNDGDTDVEINIDNYSTSAGGSSSLYTVSAGNIGMDTSGYDESSYSCNSVIYYKVDDGSDNSIPFTLAPNESKTVEIGFALGTDGTLESVSCSCSSVVFTTSAIYGGTVDAEIYYTITATQQ